MWVSSARFTFRLICVHTPILKQIEGTRPWGRNLWCVFLLDALSAIFWGSFRGVSIGFPLIYQYGFRQKMSEIEGAVVACWAQKNNIWLHSPGMPTNCMLSYIIQKSSIFQIKSNNQIASNAISVSGTAHKNVGPMGEPLRFASKFVCGHICA